MLGALLSNGDVNKIWLHSLPLMKCCICPSVLCKAERTRVCKHTLYVIHTAAPRVWSQPSLRSSCPSHALNTTAVTASWSLGLCRAFWAETSPETTFTLNKKHLSLHRTPARTSFSRTFLGWEEVRVAYEIRTSKHSFQVYGNNCLFHLALVVSKENTLFGNLESNQRKFTGK